MGYEIRGNSTVLYRSNAPVLFGEVARRELEKLDDLAVSFLSCSKSVRSHAFHTPRYLKGS